MAWGYERGFVIEHDYTVKRRIDCKDCDYYESDDKSCMKRPLYLPVDGYNSWRSCSYFELDPSTSHYDEKKAQYLDVLRRKKAKRDAEQKKISSKEGANTTQASGGKKTKGETIAMSKSNIQRSSTLNNRAPLRTQKTTVSNKNHGFKLFVFKFGKLKKGLRYDYISIVTESGSRKKIQVAFDDQTKNAFINGRVYTVEAIEKVKEALR